jgi:hypothetical protein
MAGNYDSSVVKLEKINEKKDPGFDPQSGKCVKTEKKV